MTIIVVFFIRFIFKFFIRPYIKLMAYKNFRGGEFVYIPLIGDYANHQADLEPHGDVYYSAFKRIEANPNIRALFFPLMTGVRINLYDPELIKEFFANYSKFIKDPEMFAPLPSLVRNGLVFTEGEKWKSQRKLISQVFHFDYMNACIPIINRKCLEWIDSYCRDGTQVFLDVKKTMKMYTSRVIWRMFFGEEDIQTSVDSEKFMETILNYASGAMTRCFSLYNFFLGPKFFKLGLRASDREYNFEHQIVDTFAKTQLKYFREKLSKEKDSAPKQSRNLIELLLLEASKQSGNEEKVSDLDVMSQIVTFLVAGTDTTLNLLTMTHYFLALYPEIQQKLRDEVIQHLDKTGEITYEKLSKLDYLTAILKETLRLYGPADSTFPRVATEDVILGDLLVRKGTQILPNLKIVHSSPKSFSNPQEFRPERWIEKKDPGVKDPFAYAPFSNGARRCIGEQLAWTEAKIMITELVRRYQIDIERPYKLKMECRLIYENTKPLNAIYTKL